MTFRAFIESWLRWVNANKVLVHEYRVKRVRGESDMGCQKKRMS